MALDRSTPLPRSALMSMTRYARKDRVCFDRNFFIHAFDWQVVELHSGSAGMFRSVRVLERSVRRVVAHPCESERRHRCPSG